MAFDLACKEASPEAIPVVRAQGYSQMPQRMLPDRPEQTTPFMNTSKDVSFGVGAVWREADGWKTKAISLGKYLTEADAALFGIGMVMKDLLSILSRADHTRSEIVTESRPGLTAIESARQWAFPTITGVKGKPGELKRKAVGQS